MAKQTTKNQRRAAKKREAKLRAEQRMVAIPYFTRKLLMDASRETAYGECYGMVGWMLEGGKDQHYLLMQ